MTREIRASVDGKQLDAFVNHYFNTPLPRGSVSTILSKAFNAFVAAGVIVLEDGPAADVAQFYVHGGRVLLHDADTDDKTIWISGMDGVPTFNDAITGLVDLMVAVLNAPPYTGLEDFPHTRN